MPPKAVALAVLVCLACNRNGNRTIIAAPTQPLQSSAAASNSKLDSREKSKVQNAETPPAPPPNSSIREWLELKNVPNDLAIGSLDGYNNDLSQLWIWIVDLAKFQRFGADLELDVIPPDQLSYGFIAVFYKNGPWLLTHSRSKGWVWVLLRENELGSQSIIEQTYEDHWYSLKEIEQTKHKPDADGFVTYHDIYILEPFPGELLREAPSLDSKSYGPVKRKYLQLLSFNGEWVKVIESESISWLPNKVEGEDCPLLRIKWNSNRTGWIRWKIPGPIPGSFQVLFRGTESFGYYD